MVTLLYRVMLVSWRSVLAATVVPMLRFSYKQARAPIWSGSHEQATMGPLVNYPNAIRPACPISRVSQPHGAAEAQTTKTQREGGTNPGRVSNACGINAEQRAQTCPDLIIVEGSESGGLPRIDRPWEEVGARSGTVDQQEPCALQIFHRGNAAEQNVMTV